MLIKNTWIPKATGLVGSLGFLFAWTLAVLPPEIYDSAFLMVGLIVAIASIFNGIYLYRLVRKIEKAGV